MRDEAPYLEKAREIHPAAPAAAVGELLTLSEARVVPLPAGDLCKGYGQSGTYVLAAAVRGNLTVATEGRYEMLHPGQAIALRSPGAYTLQAVSSCLGMTVHLQGDAASRLLKLHNGAALFSRGAAIVREAVMALAVLDEEHPPVDGADASARGFALLTKLCAAPAGQSEFGILSPVVESAVGIIQEEFPFLEDHLFTTVDGVEYEIYYVEGLEVPVPEEGEYTVSGNNLDGFIVTVTKTASVGEPPQVPAA